MDSNPAEVAGEPLRGLSRLLALQELDLSTDRLTSRLAALEEGEEVRVARERLAEAEGRLGELQLALGTVSRDQGKVEGDIDLMSRKVDAEKKRLFDGSVANVKELQAIEHEVANIQGRISRMEDGDLELMEQREELETKIAAAQAEVTELRERFGEIERTAGKDTVDIRRALVERRVERESLLPAFDPELLETYEDLRRTKKGVGAAALIDGVCQGCHQKLSPVEVGRMKRETGLRRCDYCRRILVFS